MELLTRAFSILSTLAEAPGSLSLAEVAARAALPRSTVHRILGVLASHDLVRQEPDSKRYRLGRGFTRFRDSYGDHLGVPELVEPALRQLSLRVGEAVFLTVIDGTEAVCVRTVESPTPLRFFMRVGAVMPAHCAASARVIAAYQPAELQARLLGAAPYRRFTARTIATRTLLAETVTLIRAQGFDVCAEEMESGVTAVAVPVHGDRGVVASVTAIGPAERLAASRLPALIPALVQTAAQIAELMGYPSTRAAVGA